MDSLHNRLEAHTQRRERIFHFRRHLGVDASCHKTVLFHISELLRQDLLGDAIERTSQLGVPVHPLKEVPQDDDLPAPTDEFDG